MVFARPQQEGLESTASVSVSAFLLAVYVKAAAHAIGAQLIVEKSTTAVSKNKLLSHFPWSLNVPFWPATHLLAQGFSFKLSKRLVGRARANSYSTWSAVTLIALDFLVAGQLGFQ